MLTCPETTRDRISTLMSIAESFPAEIHTFIHAPFQINSYVIERPDTQQAILVDIGRNTEPILALLADKNLQFDDLLHTHAFIEFMEGQPELRESLDFLAYMSPMDEFWLAHFDTQAGILNVETIPQAYVDQQVLPEDVFTIAGLKMQVLSTPGNTPGGTSYYFPELNIVFTGDTLYASAVGPTDIPYGNTDKLLESIERELFTLPDTTMVYPGRGPADTLGNIKARHAQKPFEPIVYGKVPSALS